MGTVKDGVYIPATHVYIGVEPVCGCVVAGHTDDGDKNTAKWVSDFIKSGLKVERVPVEDARNRLHHCPHKTRKRKGYEAQEQIPLENV